jgi:hypothetical protein
VDSLKAIGVIANVMIEHCAFRDGSLLGLNLGIKSLVVVLEVD